MRFIITKDYSEMSQKAAGVIAAQIITKPDCVLGLATGSTPVGTYKVLVDFFQKGDLDFSEVTTVNLDEYCGLPKENDQSYYYFMHENLFKHVNICPDQIHLPDGTETDPETACASYERIIKQCGGADLQLLGIGHNGHIGFNEPADSFTNLTHQVDLAESTIEANSRFFASREEVPTQAYTMGIGTIMRAKRILLIASGKDKAEIIRKSCFGPICPQVPASILQLHPDVTVVLDMDAASALGAMR